MSNEVAVEFMLYHTVHYSTVRTSRSDGTSETGEGVCGSDDLEFRGQSYYRPSPSPPIRLALPRSGRTCPAGMPSSVRPSALSFASSSSGVSQTS
jgi:hypothetical protein